MDDKLVFDAQWYQSEAGVTHDFVLTYYAKDNTMDLYDVKTKKSFLRRCAVDTVTVKDLFVGSRIFVYGRKILITDYGNPETKKLLGSKSQKAFLLVPGKLKSTLDEIFRMIAKQNLKIDNCATIQLREDDLSPLEDNERISGLKSNILCEPAFLFVLSGNAIDKKIDDIQDDCPGVFGSVSVDHIDHFFKENQEKFDSHIRANDSVLCIIKPHIVHANLTGDVLGRIYREGFVVRSLRLCHLDRSQTDDFLRVYEGVLPEFIQMSLHLASGALIAVELINKDSEADRDLHTRFRNLCGPYDSEIAQKLRPHTLRAEFGVNKICNAVHCTDLKEDVQRELDFFFNS